MLRKRRSGDSTDVSAMAPPKSALPKAAAPRFGAHFDPWNSSSSGHQRPDNQPGTHWRESRNVKLTSQFRGGSTGGERLSDTWGAGSEDWDPEKKVVIPKALRERRSQQRSVADMLLRPGRMRDALDESQQSDESAREGSKKPVEELLASQRRIEDEAAAAAAAEPRQKRIFEGVVVYVNGSTFPLVSDHKLKHLLSENGGQMSLHLGRRKVTHVILGRPAGGGAGAGGGLAGSKLDKEIKRIGGVGVKYVGVEWYVSPGPLLPRGKGGGALLSGGF